MKQSAGLLLFKLVDSELRLLLAHPGGPFYAKKDEGVWSIPKGEFEQDEEPLMAARREFEEELGKPAPEGKPLELGDAKQGNTKTNHIWALKADFDTAANITSNTFTMEWPPKSGKSQEFPEIDRAEWFSAGTARNKLRPAQITFIDRLEEKLGLPPSQPEGRPQIKLL